MRYIIDRMKYIFDFGIVVALVLCIAIRFFVNESSWMVIIQYIGVGIAYSDLLMNSLKTVNQDAKKFKKILRLGCIGFAVYIFLAIFGAFGIIKCLAGSKAMDIITLLTLLFSLPQKLYLKLL